MMCDPVDTIIAYHDRTKHHPGRYARSLGYLDWATQPDPFRRFHGSPLIRLPIPLDRESPSYDAIFSPGAVPPRPLSLESVSEFFYLSLALSAWKQAGPSRWSLRVNPSSGNLHPTEGYAILPVLAGLSPTPGVYHYAPREHGLEQRARLDARVLDRMSTGLTPEAASTCFRVALTSVYWREAWKYGERAFRYCLLDAGHALAALRMAAAVLGWQLVVLEELSDESVARLLGLDRAADFENAEREVPDLLAIVLPASAETNVPRGFDSRAIEAVAAAQWAGRANALSPSHVDWPAIDAAHDATIKPRTHDTIPASELVSVKPVPPGHLPPTGFAEAGSEETHSHERNVSAWRVIRTRRSALAFDGRTGMPVEVFYRMLARTLPFADHRSLGSRLPAPHRAVPWDCVAWLPCVHLFLFVHRVQGLVPGIYALLRDPDRLDAIKAACDPEFSWAVPPGRPAELPLFQLIEADCRQAAAQLSLGQEIAGASAFSLGMIAEFESPLRTAGAWQYRQLFREAGMIGQVLYLEAEAAGLRATGIGAYFDDLVHELLGLSNHAFHDLYHFTLGGPLDDPRITSAPAHPAPGVDQIMA